MVSNQTNCARQVSEQRYRDLFINIPICTFVVNLTVTPPVILEVNHRAELIYGYGTAELVGKHFIHLVPEVSKASIQNIFQRIQQGETVTAEITNLHRDGTTFPVRVNAILDPTNHGHMILTVEDITAERQRHNDAESIEVERLRIAHEIHDGVAQNLAGLRFKSALWHHLAGTASPEMHAALDELQVVLTAAIEDIRRAIFGLRPLEMKSLGFFPALRKWVADFCDQNQMVIQLDMLGQTDCLPTDYELPLFRIIQEGLNNIYQHAQSTSVLVRLAIDSAGGVVLSLIDNGRGFDPDKVGTAEQSKHFGLRQMSERILDLGGTLEIHSMIGQGTELCISLPQVTREVNKSQNSRANYATD